MSDMQVKRVLIVGGGRVGRALAVRLNDGAVVIEPDPFRAERAREAAPEADVVEGSGVRPEDLDRAGLTAPNAFDSVVVVTSSDAVNLRAVERVRERVADEVKVIARVDDPARASVFERAGAIPVTGPLSRVPSIIFNMMRPGRRSLYEAVLTEKSPVVGQPIARVPLPPDSVIVSILRGDHLVPPTPEEALEPGDVVTLISGDESVSEALNALTAHGESINPLDRVYVLLRGPESVQRAFREAYYLASNARAEVVAVAPDVHGDLLEEASQLARLNGVEFRGVAAPPGEDPLVALEGIVREADASRPREHRERGLYFEFVVVDPPEEGVRAGLLRKGPLAAFVDRVGHPIVVSRHVKPYNSVLVLIDGGPRTRSVVNYAVDVALLYGSDVTALMTEEQGAEEAGQLLTYLERVGKVYGVDVDTRRTHGHPMLEFISEVRGGSHDLVIVPWRSAAVSPDILQRVINRGKGSVLIVP